VLRIFEPRKEGVISITKNFIMRNLLNSCDEIDDKKAGHSVGIEKFRRAYQILVRKLKEKDQFGD
jgi:hypothetical protein